MYPQNFYDENHDDHLVARNQKCRTQAVYRGLDIAMTYSFGSLCYDGLLRPALHLAAYVASVFDSFMSTSAANRFLRIANSYAVAEISISPKPYAQAVRDALYQTPLIIVHH